MLNTLLPNELYKCIEKEVLPEKIMEIRIRAGQPVTVDYGKGYLKIKCLNTSSFYIAKISDIDFILGRASKHSLYAINECLIEGFIPYYKGIRIGICGEGVRDIDKLITVKNISFINIRVPHEVKNCTDKLQYNYKKPKSFLIISPPGFGKTTLLREMLKKISNHGSNCLLIDERFEVAAVSDGEAGLNVGENTDIMSGTLKNKAIQGIIRAMRPDMIFTDEIYGESEVELLIDVIRCGIKIGATIHSDNRFSLLNSLLYKKLFSYIPYVIELSNKPYVGSIQFEGYVENVDINCR